MRGFLVLTAILVALLGWGFHVAADHTRAAPSTVVSR